MIYFKNILPAEIIQHKSQMMKKEVALKNKILIPMIFIQSILNYLGYQT